MGDKGSKWLKSEKDLAARIAKNVEASLNKSGQPDRGIPPVRSKAAKKKNKEAKKDKK